MTKLPTIERPIFNDPDMCRAVEHELEPLTGKALERAQAAVRKIHGSGVVGSFDLLIATYREAIHEAAGVKAVGG